MPPRGRWSKHARALGVRTRPRNSHRQDPHARYDAVIYFVGPRSIASLKRLAAKHHWPKLVIRPIPRHN
jgi:hypothetical protein